MDPAWIIALCALGGAAGGAIGAWITLHVTIALHGQRLNVIDNEISSLRHDRHLHAEALQRLEAIMEIQRHPEWKR